MWTAEQLRAINEDGNLLVSAAAGAGKTAVMTERIARIIASGTDVSEILVVTFTNPAAAEMKQRIERRLSELAESTDDTKLKMHLHDSAINISTANISTIHSFCGNVLRRNCHIVGLDPAFRTADAAEAALLRLKALDDVLEEAYSDAEKTSDSDFRLLCDALIRDDALCTLIEDTYDFIMARPNPFGWLHEAVEAYGSSFETFSEKAAESLIASAKRNISTFYDMANELYHCFVNENNPEFEVYTKLLQTDIGFYDELMQLKTYSDWHCKIAACAFAKIPSRKGGAPAELKEYREKVKSQFKKISEAFCCSYDVERENAARIYPCLKSLEAIVRRFAEHYSELKRENALIDFNDMEQLAYTVLKNDEIAAEYKEKFKYIFVDEYQDTNSIQDAIIAAVSNGHNLFMVGDVKQSIYRFRQAEPENFLAKYQSYDGTVGKRIDLNANFRSMTSVLNAANSLFSKIMLGDVGEIDYSDNAELRMGAETANGSAEICLIDLSDEKGENENEAESENNSAKENDEPEAIEAEARCVADKIRWVIENVEVFDKEINRVRKPMFSDFAVLMRRTKGVALQFVNAMTEQGITCAAELGDGYFDAIEVQIFLNLLRIIDNRRQDIPLLSVMRSPIGGFNEDEYIHIRTDFGGEEFIDRLTEAAQSFQNGSNNAEYCRKANYFLGNVDRWHEMSRFLSVDELIGTLLDETFYYVYVGALRGGAVRQANLDLLLEKAQAFVANGKSGLHGFVTLMDSLRDNVSMGAAQPSAIDAVRVMSIHKSKGLEFPIVFICGTTSEFSKKSHKADAVFDRELGIGFRMRGKNPLTPLLRRAIMMREDDRLVSEEMRNLYVAMTRPRERLYIIGSSKKMADLLKKFAAPLSKSRIMNSKCYLDWMLGAYFPLGINLDNAGSAGVKCAIGADKLLLRCIKKTPNSTDETRMSKAEYIRWSEEARSTDCSAVSRRLEYRYPFEDDTKQKSKRSVTEIIKGEKRSIDYDFSPSVPIFLQPEHVLTGAERGTATHIFLQMFPLGIRTEAEINNVLKRLSADGVLSEQQAKSVNMFAIKRFLQSGLYERMSAAANDANELIKRELEFTLLLDVNKNNVVVQGIIDCCFTENNEWIIVDYKTTSTRDKDPRDVANSYRMQLQIYADALQKLSGLPVKETWVYLLSAGEAFRVSREQA